MVSKNETRNQKVKNILDQLFQEIKLGQYTDELSFSKDIETLFEGPAWGFREVMLTICIARLLDPNYKASENYYSCNPRPLYEECIKPNLDEKKIPNRKSGPLNVTKSVERINHDEWAINRRPRKVAETVVSINEKLESRDADVRNFTKLLIKRFLQEAKVVEESNVIIDEEADPSFLYKICKALIDSAPDYGNTPQKIVGYLLESYHEDIESRVTVKGHTDRASTSSTTGKKLGDITEDLLDINRTLLSYEVTVKKFDKQRVKEAYEAAKKYAGNNEEKVNEIIVICRKEDMQTDIEPVSSLYLGKSSFRDITFLFLDIYEWITAQIFRLSVNGRLMFFEKLQKYIHHKDTSKTVKDKWAELKPKN